MLQGELDKKESDSCNRRVGLMTYAADIPLQIGVGDYPNWLDIELGAVERYLNEVVEPRQWHFRGLIDVDRLPHPERQTALTQYVVEALTNLSIRLERLPEPGPQLASAVLEMLFHLTSGLTASNKSHPYRAEWDRLFPKLYAHLTVYGPLTRAQAASTSALPCAGKRSDRRKPAEAEREVDEVRRENIALYVGWLAVWNKFRVTKREYAKEKGHGSDGIERIERGRKAFARSGQK